MQNRSVIVRISLFVAVAGFSSDGLGHVASGEMLSAIVAVRGKTPKRVWSLANMSSGASPSVPIDPTVPTFVITHGWNPMPNKVRLSTPQAYARKIGERYGASANVLAFHWDSRFQGSPRRNDENAIRAGQILARELLARRVIPEQTHMIGHSMGSIVIASAANRIHCDTGRCTDKLTMIDGPSFKVHVFIDQLAATKCAHHVINVWADGPTGAGMSINRPGVENVQVPNRRARLRLGRRRFRPSGTNRFRDVSGRDLTPAVINHIDILIWYYQHCL